MNFSLSEPEKLLCKQVGRHFPQFVELVDRLRQQELETMALTTPEHFCTYKGRVQVLTQMKQHISAP